MANSLILQLNKLIDKTPDQIVSSLKNPWTQLGHMTREFYSDNLERRVYLFNTRTAPGYYYTGSLSQPPRIEEGVARPVANWGYNTFSESRNASWYWAYEEEAVPFIIGEHDVRPD